MKIKKINVIKKSLLMESSIIDVISKLSPMEVKILKAITKRFGDSYLSDKEVIDELVENWGIDFYIATKLAKIYKTFKFYITHAPSEEYKEVNKSEVFVEYFSRFILKYDKDNTVEYGRELLDRLTFKYRKGDTECEGELKTDFWVYDRNVLGYNKYFSFYSTPNKRYGDECYISSVNAILTQCTIKEFNDTEVKLEYHIKYEQNRDNEVIHNFTDTLPIPETLDYDSCVEWFKERVYGESYQKALNSTDFQFDVG